MIQHLFGNIYDVEGDDSKGPSPKIGIVLGQKEALLVDVSNESSRLEEALDFIRKERGFISGDAVLTHFHPDHIDNLPLLPEGWRIYLSKNTARYVHRPSFVVTKDLCIDLGGESAQLLLVPSLHSKGSIDVLVGDYLFVGDSLYSRYQGDALYFNREILFEEIKKMESIPFRYAIPAHQGALKDKEDVLAHLKKALEEGRMEE